MEGVEEKMPSNREPEVCRAVRAVDETMAGFCDRFIAPGSQTAKRLLEAASDALRHLAAAGENLPLATPSGASLLRAARACLTELLQVLEEFLRIRELPVWDQEHPQAKAIRKLVSLSSRSYGVYGTFVQSAPPEAAANALICLVRHTGGLLAREMERQAAEPSPAVEIPGRIPPAY